MKTAAARTLCLPLALLGAALVATGCSETPLEKYKEATEALNEALAAKEESQNAVQAMREEVAQAQEELTEASEALAAADAAVQEARQTIDEVASDKVLFRVIQNKLLNQSRFEDAAISVSVVNNVVTLDGSVPDEATRKAAIQLAASQIGVDRVNHSLIIAGPAGDEDRPEELDDEPAAQNEAPPAAEPRADEPNNLEPAAEGPASAGIVNVEPPGAEPANAE